MSNKLSYSQVNKWLFCSAAWHNHYIGRWRPLELSSALPFGSALGKAFEFILDNTKLDPVFQNDPDPTRHVSAEEVFDYHWSYTDVNGELTNLKEYPHMAYSRYDTDYELLEFYNVKNKTAWESLRLKAHLILETFRTELLPQIEKVYSTEEKVELSNEEGDSNVGFADAVVKLKGVHKPVVLDFKTASRSYEEDSVRTSVQLSQYLHVLSEKYENTRLAGYAVFLKNIEKNRVKVCKACKHDGSGSRAKTCDNEIEGKRCGGAWVESIKPKASMQLIIDSIPEKFEMTVIDNVAAVNSAIHSGIIVKNLNKCSDNGYGRKCEFYNLCHTDTTEGLIRKE